MTRDRYVARVDPSDAHRATGGQPPAAVCYLVATVERSGETSDLRVRVEFRPDIGRGRRRTVNVRGADAALDVVGQWLATLGDRQQ